MKEKLKPIILELIWLVICVCLSILIVLLFWKWNFKYHLITIRILGSSVAFSDFGLLYSLWLLIILIVYTLKEAKSKYRRALPNAMAISSGLLFIVYLSFLQAGWTSYPPLAGLGLEGLTSEEFENIILGLRIMAGLFISIVIYNWIRRLQLTNFII
jgi:hypothetical protein